jgi:hypothetical protein
MLFTVVKCLICEMFSSAGFLSLLELARLRVVCARIRFDCFSSKPTFLSPDKRKSNRSQDRQNVGGEGVRNLSIRTAAHARAHAPAEHGLGAGMHSRGELVEGERAWSGRAFIEDTGNV